MSMSPYIRVDQLRKGFLIPSPIWFSCEEGLNIRDSTSSFCMRRLSVIFLKPPDWESTFLLRPMIARRNGVIQYLALALCRTNSSKEVQQPHRHPNRLRYERHFLTLVSTPFCHIVLKKRRHFPTMGLAMDLFIIFYRNRSLSSIQNT